MTPPGISSPFSFKDQTNLVQRNTQMHRTGFSKSVYMSPAHAGQRRNRQERHTSRMKELAQCETAVKLGQNRTNHCVLTVFTRRHARLG